MAESVYRSAAILTYHALDETGSVLSTAPAVFAKQMRSLVEAGIQVVPLRDLLGALDPIPPTRPVVALTFDDGFRSVLEHGLPVLVELGLPATVFLVTDRCGRTSSWPGQTAGLGGRPLLGWEEIRAMSAAGVEFGSHSRTHPDLRGADTGAIEAELVGSRRAIEDALGRPADTFAYPYGAHDARVRDVARAHFTLACGTTLGLAGARSDRFDLPRVDMYYFRGVTRLGRLFTYDTRAYLGVRRALRACRGWVSRA